MVEENRRRWRRLESAFKVGLHWRDHRGAHQVEARGTHLSPEGIFVQLAEPPDEGTSVTVHADLGGLELTVDGVVSRSVPLDDGTKHPPGVGIHLDHAGAPWRKLYQLLRGQVEGEDPGTLS